MLGKFKDKIIKYVLTYVENNDPNQYVSSDVHGLYLKRWYVIPKNRYFKIYIHEFLRDDKEGFLHDHPFSSISLCCSGSLREFNIRGVKTISVGDIVFRKGSFAHKLHLSEEGVAAITLFITGPNFRKWGFITTEGWVYWKEYLNIKEVDL